MLNYWFGLVLIKVWLLKSWVSEFWVPSPSGSWPTKSKSLKTKHGSTSIEVTFQICSYLDYFHWWLAALPLSVRQSISVTKIFPRKTGTENDIKVCGYVKGRWFQFMCSVAEHNIACVLLSVVGCVSQMGIYNNRLVLEYAWFSLLPNSYAYIMGCS